MTTWPGLIEPWTPLVNDRDIGFARWNGGTQCAWCHQERGTPHVEMFGRKCSRLEWRQRTRISMIARFHLYLRHNLTPHDEAERYQGWRDALIADLRAHGMLDRDVFKECVAELAPDIDRAVTHRAQYRHLDEGWNGEGIEPSMLASLRDCMVRAGAIPDDSDRNGILAE